MPSSCVVLGAVAVVAVLALLLPSVSSIQCYQCNSAMDEHCQDLGVNQTVSQSYLRECKDTTMPENSTPFCRKIVQTILAEGDRRVIRKCGYEKDAKQCYHYDDDDHAEVVCQCFEEACNSAPASASAVARALVATGVAALLAMAR